MTLNSIRKKVIKTAYTQKSGHIASSFSILEILYVLYNDILGDNDLFVLSKGHAALGFYAVLNELGKISNDELASFTSYDSNLGGHPDRNKVKDAFASAGSLGHGLPISVGVALSRKIQDQAGKIYCLVGDGECNEGSIWESSLLASHLNLDNLVCIVDNNRSQTRAVETKNIEEKFSSFGWETIVVDGHNTELLKSAFKNIKNLRPICIIANTVKGYGIESIQNDAFSWHHRSPSDKEFENMMSELK